MLEIQDIVVEYGGFTAVKDARFTVQDGEFFTLLGPSGCGKTTTLRTIAGFEKASSGRILLNGKDVSALAPEERDIGFVFQNYALFPSMTVRDNIAFGLKIRHVKKAESEQRVREMAEMIGITEHLPKKISQISGGQQQRVAIARALITGPCLLLMDEPLSNLDAKLRVTMRAEIKRIQKELGIEAVYVTHDQEEAMAISDRIAVFNHGVIEQIGTPQEIYYHPKTEFTARFVGDINELDGELLSGINRVSPVAVQGRCFVRPEAMTLCAAKEEVPSGKICFPAKVEDAEFLGASTKLTLCADGGKLRCMTFRSALAAPGQEVWVWLDPADLTVPEDGK